MFKLVSQVYKIAPGVLTEHGKTKVFAPNLKLLPPLGSSRLWERKWLQILQSMANK
jgi:hypothetical protein